MELCVNDRITAHPSREDVGRAIDATPHPEGWYLILESDDALIEAGAEADSRYTVSGSDKGREFEAGTPLNADQVKEILLKFLAGDTTWRDANFWTFLRPSYKSLSAPRSTSGHPMTLLDEVFE